MKHPPEPRLERYRTLVSRYHRSLDLVSDAALTAFDQKVADALAYAEAIRAIPDPAPRILDVGSGVGLPGIVIGVALPEAAVALVERRKKRCTFLRIVLARLELTNVTLYEADVRDLRLEPVSVITAQAVARFMDLYCLTRHLQADELRLLSRKGPDWREEVAVLQARLGLRARAEERAELSSHGRLVEVSLTGGKPCPS